MKKFINYLYAFVELILAFTLSRKIIWRLINYRAIKEYKNTKKELSNEQLKILEDIKKNGFAVTNLDGTNTQTVTLNAGEELSFEKGPIEIIPNNNEWDLCKKNVLKHV